MTNNKNLKKYFALSIVIIFALWILYLMKAYFKPILIAAIITFLVYPIYKFILNKTKKKVLSSILIIVSLILIVLIPLSATAGGVLNYINNFDLNEETLQKYENSIFELTGKEISITETIQDFVNYIKNETTQSLPEIVSFTSNFLVSTFVMFFVMFYLLVENKFIIRNLVRMLPFSNKNSKHLLSESGKVIKAILIGQVLTATIQGMLGMFSFFIAGVEGAFFWGLIMIILSLIPVVGAFIIWIPVGVLMILEGNIGWGIFILAWGALIVSQVDNIVRPKLVNKFADIHPLETLLGVFMGLTAFGIIGIIIGPLILSLFGTVVKVYLEEYDVS